MKLECVASLRQHALLIDVVAQVLADNRDSPMCIAAAQQADLPGASRRCNLVYAPALPQRKVRRLVLLIGDFISIVADVLCLLGANTRRVMAGRSRPPPLHHIKPHRSAFCNG